MYMCTCCHKHFRGVASLAIRNGSQPPCGSKTDVEFRLSRKPPVPFQQLRFPMSKKRWSDKWVVRLLPKQQNGPNLFVQLTNESDKKAGVV